MSDEMFRRYRELVVWGGFQPVDDNELDQVEREIGRPLPPSYRRFMLTANGGNLEYAVSLPPGESGEPISFSALVPVQQLTQQWREHHADAVLPAGLLPVAQDGGGSRLHLDLRPASYGQVLAFVHGLPAWAGDAGGDSAGVVAMDWDDYLGQLAIEADIAEITWEELDEDDSAEGRAWRDAVIAWLDAGLPDWRERDWAGGGR